uniref:Uncharacterized protein n=1 Tax=Tetranychus urticae TaxID=32264 RepID=T1KKM9_TETUR
MMAILKFGLIRDRLYCVKYSVKLVVSRYCLENLKKTKWPLTTTSYTIQ